jgi:hypothetical protein
MTKDKTDLPPPTVPPCMLFCDGAIVEAGTGKTTLVGTFSGIAAADFPSPPMDLHIYVQLTSLIGDMPVRLSCLRLGLQELEEVYSTTQTVHFRGKLIVEQLYIEWKNFRFPAPGEYSFQLWSQGQCIAERRFTARLKGD